MRTDQLSSSPRMIMTLSNKWQPISYLSEKGRLVMKSKTKIWVIIVGLIALIGIGGAFRYHQVNANIKQKGSSTKSSLKKVNLFMPKTLILR